MERSKSQSTKWGYLLGCILIILCIVSLWQFVDVIREVKEDAQNESLSKEALDNKPMEDNPKYSCPDTLDTRFLENGFVSLDREISESDLNGKTQRELEIMRNSVYARHGYRFKRDDLFNYFYSFPWYNPTTSDLSAVSNSMTIIEKRNVEMIKNYERAVFGNALETSFPKTSDYGLSLSNKRLSESDLGDKTQRDLEIMRNGIYARLGYRFKRDDLFDYFSQYSWYNPTTSDMAVVRNSMSDIEKYNVDFIMEHE